MVEEISWQRAMKNPAFPGFDIRGVTVSMLLVVVVVMSFRFVVWTFSSCVLGCCGAVKFGIFSACSTSCSMSILFKMYRRVVMTLSP